MEVASTLLNMGGAYHLQGEYDKTIDVYNRALVILEEIREARETWSGSYQYSRDPLGIAIVLDEQEKYDDAMEEFSKILPIYEKK